MNLQAVISLLATTGNSFENKRMAKTYELAREQKLHQQYITQKQ
jgi:hypothetical protein